MVEHELMREDGVLLLRPKASLEAADFAALAREIDPYIEANGKLHGLMLDAASFPGWKDLEALLAHVRFVKDHHKKIQRVAVVSDSGFLSVAPKLASHFVLAELKHFSASHREEAIAWLRGEAE